MNMITLVKRIQKLCNIYSNADIVEDGLWGPKTDLAYAKAIDSTVPMALAQPESTNFMFKEFFSNEYSNGRKLYKVTPPPQSMWGRVQQQMDRLELVRTLIEQETGEVYQIFITSGWRSEEYESYRVAHDMTDTKNSPHKRIATDIYAKHHKTGKRLPVQQLYDLADKVFKEGGVGIYRKSLFVHVDLDEVNKRPARWDKQ